MWRVAELGHPLDSAKTFKTIRFDSGVPVSSKADTARILERRVVEESLELLDQILVLGDTVIVQIAEAIYMAACRCREKRFGEAVILAWGACEQLISIEWTKLIDVSGSQGDATSRLPKDRRSKLTGRDYTASVMIEMLELQGRINPDLYRQLEVGRKASNKWAHEMREPRTREIDWCIKAAEVLLLQVAGISLWVDGRWSVGVPSWPVWMWQDAKFGKGSLRSAPVTTSIEVP